MPGKKYNMIFGRCSIFILLIKVFDRFYDCVSVRQVTYKVILLSPKSLIYLPTNCIFYLLMQTLNPQELDFMKQINKNIKLLFT